VESETSYRCRHESRTASDYAQGPRPELVHEVFGGQNKTLNEIQVSLIAEFKKPKSESQCITELKEIKQLSGETTWDFD